MKIRFPLHVHLSVLFVLTTLLIGGTIAVVSYTMSQDMLESSAEELTSRAAREVAGEIRSIIRPASMATDMLAHHRLAYAETEAKRLDALSAMQTALNGDPGISSLYIGYDSGDYLFFHRISSEGERLRFGAPVGSRYQLRSIERSAGRSEARYLYLDEKLFVLEEQSHSEYLASFDPRARGWYQGAMTSEGTVTMPPYLFFSTGDVGLTIARRAEQGNSVIGADIPLSSLGEVLRKQKVTPSSELVLVNGAGEVVGYEDLQRLIQSNGRSIETAALRSLASFGLPALSDMTELIADGRAAEGVRKVVELDHEAWRVSAKAIPLPGASPLYLLVAIPESELFAAAFKVRRTTFLISLLMIGIAIPLILILSRMMTRSIRALAAETEAIRHFEFNKPIHLDSSVAEVDALARAMDGMKSTIARFGDITQSVAAEKDFDKLLSKVLKETMTISESRAGVLYLLDEKHFTACSAHAQEGCLSHDGLFPVAIADLPAVMCVACESGHPKTGKLTPGEVCLAGLQSMAGDHLVLNVLVVPLFNRQHVMLGMMLLIRDEQIDEAQMAFISALTSSASSSIETRGLIRDQKQLFQAFIQLIAGAIDAKSPYTGGHCSRVPELTKMLARAACEQKDGPYADFRMDDEAWESLHIAAWLHDCGKVTTPEYVVDKATKLETIYDRIHEVRMRFEVLKRDAEIRCWKSIAEGMPAQQARNQLQQECDELDDDFAFVAQCNEGGETMSHEHLARLSRIAERTWSRSLDDSLGISEDEKQRRGTQMRQRLPVTERLLMDKPEHVFKREAQHWMAAGNRWGFKMDVPEHLYNRGELHNLSVTRGTLSDEERYKINEHMVQTIIMLSQLPFPRHLQQVPEIAGGHHERMDGQGYPRRLRGSDMSPAARMMAIADIFEALTAADRPYKKGKTLSEAVDIMFAMKQAGHIDPELFELFLQSGVMTEYATRFMAKEQIDDVNIARYVDNAELAQGKAA